jgi:uncharacterized protein (UPF0332 family)/predicted nucleotidyltransferase
MVKNSKKTEDKGKKSNDFPTLNIISELDVATDFAQKAYKKFDKLIKSIIVFGSTVKKTTSNNSDIDLVILIDDASIKFDQELISWYREELGKILTENPYRRELHINTIRLTTWWQDLLRGDPLIINIIRHGEEIIDFGGFFRPLRILLEQGKIKSTPESIYTALQRAPMHLANSKKAELGAIEGVYWAMVESAHALLIAAKISPPSPEHIPILLKTHFLDKKLIEEKYIAWYAEIYRLYKGISHGEIRDIRGQNIDDWQEKADLFIRKMSEIINKII